MIPLTASLYVEAELDDADKVLVELGTGYYAEVPMLESMTAHGLSRCLTAALKHSAFHVQKSAKDGKDYFGRKVLLVKEQLDKIGQVCHCYWLLWMLLCLCPPTLADLRPVVHCNGVFASHVHHVCRCCRKSSACMTRSWAYYGRRCSKHSRLHDVMASCLPAIASAHQAVMSRISALSHARESCAENDWEPCYFVMGWQCGC